MTSTAINLEILEAANQNSPSSKAEAKSSEFKLERPDWVMFRSVGTLSQKAGVAAHKLRPLVIKELVDNALDAGANVRLDQVGDKYVITDDGPGIDGTPQEIGRMFSIGRGMVSSKLWRLPKRGALGNGLRVVAGAVLSSSGTLTVTTKNQEHRLTPMDDGTTAVRSAPVDFPTGTKIEIEMGADIPVSGDDLGWGRQAIAMAVGEQYAGKPSPFWYDGDHFFELLQAAGKMLVREFVGALDGCSGAKAGQIAAEFKGRECTSLDRQEATALLLAARSNAKPVSANRLGSVGFVEGWPPHRAIRTGTVTIGHGVPLAEVPYVIEAWAEHSEGDSSIECFINRTPMTGHIHAFTQNKRYAIRGCGLGYNLKVPRDLTGYG